MKKKPLPKVRRKWAINPKTRVKESEKTYKRAKLKQQLKKELKKSNNSL